jgi:hypothetical protein
VDKSPFTVPAAQHMLQAYDDKAWVALAAAIDAAVGGVQSDLVELQYIYVPERTPAQLLDDLGAMMAAGMKATDSVVTKRRKLATAVQGHKRRSTWLYSLKPAIDAVTGFSSSIYMDLFSNWPVRVGDAERLLSGYPWYLRGDGAAYGGTVRVGSGLEAIVAGNVYVDVGTSGLTAEQVAQVVAQVKDDIVPAYFRVFLGYTTAGAFTQYAGGQIG